MTGQGRSREVHLIARPHGEPSESDFAIVEVDVPTPGPGEILVRNTWMTIDPAMRLMMSNDVGAYLPPYPLNAPLGGMAVGEVVESKADGYIAGEQVLHPLGWRDYALVPTTGEVAVDRIDVDEATPARAYLGLLSMNGLTSYVGLTEAAGLRDGDVVFVSAAAGAVGGLAVQIAKARGHTVIASAGSAKKVRYLLDELGVDAAFDYRSGNVRDLLANAVSDGIDVYFDNVGGEHLEAALDAMHPGGRIALCGAVSTYNATEPVPGPRNLFQAVIKGLRLRGFLAGEFAGQLDEFRALARRWLAEGTIRYPETIVESLDRAPGAVISQLRGENIGKVLVHIS